MSRYSNSKIQCYKSCKRLYELKYLYGVEPKRKADSLQTGSSYHSKVEQINKTGDFERDGDVKTNAMATAYKKFILPKLGKVVDAERWWEESFLSHHTLCGIIDAVAEDGTPIEFKTTSGAIDGDYWLGLENDEQILMYLMHTGTFRIIYAVIQVPTIRQKKDETDDEFEQRCVDWFDESKAQVNVIQRTQDDLLEFASNLGFTVSEIENYEAIRKMAIVNPFYPNPNNCRKWGRLCEYAPICKHYDPEQEYIDFEVARDVGEKT